MATTVREAELALRGVRCWARVGCSAEERAEIREILIDVVLRFSGVPAACGSDALGDSVCYAEIARLLQGLCQEKEFALIEKLGADAFDAVRSLLPADLRLGITVTKEKPPLLGVEAARFSLREWES